MNYPGCLKDWSRIYWMILVILGLHEMACQHPRLEVREELRTKQDQCDMVATNINCACSKRVVLQDINIYLTQSESTYEFVDSLRQCFLQTLTVYDRTFSLDSIFYLNNGNAAIPYWPGFIDGVYRQKGDSIHSILKFLNQAANSSRSTTHEFLINYIKGRPDKVQIGFQFTREGNAFH